MMADGNVKFPLFNNFCYDIQYQIFKQATINYLEPHRSVFRYTAYPEYWADGNNVRAMISEGLHTMRAGESSTTGNRPRERRQVDEFLRAAKWCPIRMVCMAAHNAFRYVVYRANPIYFIACPRSYNLMRGPVLPGERPPTPMPASTSTSANALFRCGFRKGSTSILFLNISASVQDTTHLIPFLPYLSSVTRLVLPFNFWYCDPTSFNFDRYSFVGKKHQFGSTYFELTRSTDDAPRAMVSCHIDDEDLELGEEFRDWTTGHIYAEVARLERDRPIRIAWKSNANQHVFEKHCDYLNAFLNRLVELGILPSLKMISIVARKVPVNAGTGTTPQTWGGGVTYDPDYMAGP